MFKMLSAYLGLVPMLLCVSSLAYAQKHRNIRAGEIYGTIPHVVDGATWKTTITIVNLDKATRKYKLMLYGDNGSPKSFAFIGRNSASSYSGEIPRGGIAVFETPGTSSQLNSGWAELDGVGTDSAIGISAVFGTTGIPGRPDFEANVPGEFSLQYDGIFPFDNTRGYVTSIALVNPGSFSSVTMPLTIYDENGTVLKTDSVSLASGNKTAFALPDRWRETAGNRGTIHFQGTIDWWCAIGFRFHPAGAFTTVAVMEP
jgi:hypothetical protein